jgi:hypothetical protein
MFSTNFNKQNPVSKQENKNIDKGQNVQSKQDP